MSEDYMDKMRSEIRAARGWNFWAGVALGLTPFFSVWFARAGADVSFAPGAAVLCMTWVIFIALGRSHAAGMRILTELSSLNTLVTLYESNSRGLHSNHGGLASAGGVTGTGHERLVPVDEYRTAIRPKKWFPEG